MRAYLDHNATAPLRAEARQAVIEGMDLLGNPSSVHAEGRAARGAVERARAQVAALVGCEPAVVIFTSGATEAAGVLDRRPGAVAVDPLAHDCLWAHRRAGEGASTLAAGFASGETGVIERPARDGRWHLGELAGDALLTDLTQAAGRIPVDFDEMGADMAILSSHKIGGPKGVGALVLKEGVQVSPLSQGGGQELGRRSGTENVAGIMGFGAACTAAARDLADGVWERVRTLRDRLEGALESGSVSTIFVGKETERLPNTSCFATPGWKGETQVIQMDLAGFAISAGSACSSGKVRESRVLRAMGFDAQVASSAVRVSLGPGTTAEEVDRFADAWLRARTRYRAEAA